MTERRIYQELKKTTRAEMAFRDAELVRNGTLSQEAYLEQYKDCPADIKIALFPEEAEEILRDKDFFLKGRNVSVMKHGRGMPLYFHDHAFFEMFYVLEGSCTQYFEESSMELKQGDFCILSLGVRHAIVEDGSALILNALIRYETFMDIFINMIRDKTVISEFFLGSLYAEKRQRMLLFHTGEDTQIRDYMLDLYEEQQEGDAYADRICCNILGILFAQLVRRFQDTLETSDIFLSKNETAIDLLRYMVSNYEHVTIEELAEEFHYSRQYCSRLFRKHFGKSFRDMLIEIRMEKGKQYLQYSDLDIAQISEKIGYANPETFVRMLKRETGMTPGQYRKKKIEL